MGNWLSVAGYVSPASATNCGSIGTSDIFSARLPIDSQYFFWRQVNTKESHTASLPPRRPSLLPFSPSVLSSELFLERSLQMLSDVREESLLLPLCSLLELLFKPLPTTLADLSLVELLLDLESDVSNFGSSDLCVSD